jgi:multidrug resistance efflux pump
MSATILDHWTARSGLAIGPLLWRLLKLGAACGVLASGAYAVWSAHGFLVSDNAVVSAYVTSLRAPIEGYVSGRATPMGAEIHMGDVLATMTNPLVDDQRLADLEERVNRLTQEEAAIVRQQDALEARRRELMQRAEEHRHAMLARLSGQLASSQMALEAKVAENEQARHDYRRKLDLARSGTASVSDLERAQYGSEALDRQVRSLSGQLAAVQAQYAAAEHGILTEDGGNDVPYSVQRADEVQLRLAELDRALDTVRQDAQEAKVRAAAERRRIGMLRSATLDAPSAGMLWKVGASTGERLGPGDTAAELVDCGAAFLVAAVPQKNYSNIVLGGEARYRLSGETADRTGKIISITGDASLVADRNLAAVPLDLHQPMVMARIAVPPSANTAAECLVGRTARVLLPTAGDGVRAALSQLAQRIF